MLQFVGIFPSLIGHLSGFGGIPTTSNGKLSGFYRKRVQPLLGPFEPWSDFFRFKRAVSDESSEIPVEISTRLV